MDAVVMDWTAGAAATAAAILAWRLREQGPRLGEPTWPKRSQLPSDDGPTPEYDLSTSTSVSFHEALFIAYVDAGGRFSERRIATNSLVQWSDADLAIRAFCYERRAFRTFLVSRVQSATDISTGEVHKDPAKYFWHAYEQHASTRPVLSPSAVIEPLMDSYYGASLVLAYVARIDGRMTAPDRAIIAELYQRYAPGMPAAAIDAAIKQLRSEDAEFRSKVAELSRADGALRSQLVGCARRIAASDGVVSDAETNALNWLCSRLEV